jgi:hypothetical protein
MNRMAKLMTGQSQSFHVKWVSPCPPPIAKAVETNTIFRIKIKVPII